MGKKKIPVVGRSRLGAALLGLVVASALGLGERLRVEAVDRPADSAEAPEDL